MLFRTLIAVLTLIFVSSANAVLMDSNDGTYNTVSDSKSNLEWLDLTYTDAMNYNDALATFSGEGWRWATETEYENMIDSMFPTYVGGSAGSMAANEGTIESDQVSLFVDYFGSTVVTSDFVFSYGFYLDDLNTLRLGGVQDNNTSNADFIYRDYTGNYDLFKTTGSASFGVFLVKEASVPVPATLALLVLGLAGLRLARRSV